jgi:hypothetical protein
MRAMVRGACCGAFLIVGCSTSHGPRSNAEPAAPFEHADGGTAAPEAGAAADPASTRLLLGDFRHDYFTAGLLSAHWRFVFNDGGRMFVDMASSGVETMGLEGYCADGTYQLRERGMLRYDWSSGSANIEREETVGLVQSLAHASGPPSAHPDAQGFLVRHAYVATDDAARRFVRTRSHRVSGGLPTIHLAVETTLEFSAAPSLLVPGSTCELSLDVEVEFEVNGNASSESASFELPCSVRSLDRTNRQITVAGWLVEGEDGTTQVPLHAAPPYAAQRAWIAHLERAGYAERWPAPHYEQLKTAFSPDLVFEHRRVSLLYPRYLDASSADPTVLARVPEDTEPPYWSQCGGR